MNDDFNPGSPTRNCIRTFTGKLFDPFDIKPEDINLKDIAKGLSNVCRYQGQTTFHYSVAQHSVYISRALPEEYKLYGLLHDASEAYLSDIPKPLKVRPEMAFYREAEAAVQRAIYKRFGLNEVEPDILHKLDRAIWGNEIPALFRGQRAVHGESIPDLKVVTWRQRNAYSVFLHEYSTLTKETDHDLVDIFACEKHLENQDWCTVCDANRDA
jgi:hypothetical protein